MRPRFDVAIIGGMGPAATAELMRRIVLYTDAKKDSEHPSLCVFSDPNIPDRSDFIISSQNRKHRLNEPPLPTTKRQKPRLNAPPSPLKAIMRRIRAAKKLRCRFFAIDCNTAHYFYKEYEKVRGIKFINTVRETAKYAFYAYPDREICVLATAGTARSDIYGLLSPEGARIKYPSPPVCEKIMRLVRKIKGGGQAELDAELHTLKSRLKAEFNAEKTVFILGCTELSLVKDSFYDLAVIDSTDVLAGCVISVCKKRFNEETFNLKSGFFNKGQP